MISAFRGAGLDPFEQQVPGCGGANVLATLPGELDRWILVGAHHDHLGARGSRVYWGADDNAAAVAILVEVAARLTADRPRGRGVIFASFDGEEPPYFLTAAMGSEHFARHPIVPIEQIDLMICMDLVGHRLGGAGLPDAVGQSLFALGAERSSGTAALVDADATREPGVIIRRLDADVVPPLSDYYAFSRRSIPFVFLSAGRSRRYHTTQDTPDGLDWQKMTATACWLERFIRQSCERATPPRFAEEARDDAATLRSLLALTEALGPYAPQARAASAMAAKLLSRCDPTGRLPTDLQRQVVALLGDLEHALA